MLTQDFKQKQIDLIFRNVSELCKKVNRYYFVSEGQSMVKNNKRPILAGRLLREISPDLTLVRQLRIELMDRNYWSPINSTHGYFIQKVRSVHSIVSDLRGEIQSWLQSSEKDSYIDSYRNIAIRSLESINYYLNGTLGPLSSASEKKGWFYSTKHFLIGH